jgi:hypothetical protein
MESMSDSEDEAAGTTNANNEGWFSNVEDNKPVGRKGLAAAATDAPTPAVPVEVYDLGATCRLSLYCEDFTSMCDIAPCPFNVANGSSFSAPEWVTCQLLCPMVDWSLSCS